MVYRIDGIVFLGNYQIIEIDFVLSKMESVEIVFHALAERIEDFLEILFAVYRYAGKGDFIETDINTMKEILELVQQKLKSQNSGMDKIQTKQLKWFCGNLEMFISQKS